MIELGRIEAASGGDGLRRWETAADQIRELEAADRVRALADLGEATYSSGLIPAARDHFEAAYELVSEPSTSDLVDDETMGRIVAGLSTSSLLSGRRHAGVAARLTSLLDRPPVYPDVPTRALMASAAGEVALGVDMSADVVRRLVDGALGAEPLPSTVLRTVFEPLGAALSLTGRADEAVALLDAQLADAHDHHDLVAHVSLLPLRAHAHLLAGRLGAALSDGVAAIDLIEAHPGATRLADAPARYVVSVALLEMDEVAEATAVCDVADHRERWGGTPMHGWFLDGLARVHAAAHRHDEAIQAWIEASRAFTLVGGRGVICEWRDGLARSMLATGDARAARDIADEQLDVAESFGDPRMRAIATSTTAAVEPDHRRAADLLRVALEQLPRTASHLTRCQLSLERGARLRRAGLRRAAREQLGAGLAIASRLDAHRLERLIRDELVAAGSAGAAGSARGTASGTGGRLTEAEQRVAALAADGLGNVEIAQRCSVSRKTVEAQLTSVYRKLGIAGRAELATVLAPTVADSC